MRTQINCYKDEQNRGAIKAFDTKGNLIGTLCYEHMPDMNKLCIVYATAKINENKRVILQSLLQCFIDAESALIKDGCCIKSIEEILVGSSVAEEDESKMTDLELFMHLLRCETGDGSDAS